jgi:hypothetical protein
VFVSLDVGENKILGGFCMIPNKKTALLLIVFTVALSINLYSQNPFESPTALPDADANYSQAIACGDYDKDGWVDVYISRANDQTGAQYINYLYRNVSGAFSMVTIAGITDIARASGGVSWGDYNNDGYIDLYVANAQPGFGQPKPQNSLFLNNGAGSFTDMTGNATTGAIATDQEDTRNVSWGDYDNNGYLDMYVHNAAIGAYGPAKAAASFYSNDGDGTFTDETLATIGNIVSTNPAYTTFGSGIGWSDYNNDGYMDIFSPSGGGATNKLWKNNQAGQFTDDTPSVMNPSQTSISSCSWGDYDNDGDRDLYAVNIVDGSTVRNFLFNNSSTPSTTSFTDITGAGTIVTDEWNAQGSGWADYDNDGDLDMFVVNKDGSGHTGAPSTLYANNGGPGSYNFTKIQDYYAPGTVSDSYQGRGMAWLDMDNDGFQDLIVCRQGQPNLYLNNLSNGNHWVMVACEGDGVHTNTTAIGVKVKATASITGQGGVTAQMREISGQTGGGGQNEMRAHFGLGNATSITSLEVQWLGSVTNTFSGVPSDKIIYLFQIGNGQTRAYTHPLGGVTVQFNTASAATGSMIMWKYNAAPADNSYSGSAQSQDNSMITPDGVVADRYWNVSGAGLSGMSYTISLDIANLPSGIDKPDKLVVVKRDAPGSPWLPQNSTRSGNVLTAAGFTAFSEFAIGYSSHDQSLPVTLTMFKAIPADNQVELQWATQSEVENLGFILERSANNCESFQVIASYKTDPDLRGHGNSSISHDYRYLDRNVLNGPDYYYRLSDVDINGKIVVHNTIQTKPVRMTGDFNLLPNYPNPFNSSTSVIFDAPASFDNLDRMQIGIYNAAGQLIRLMYDGSVVSGRNMLRWNGRNESNTDLPSGVYFVKVDIGGMTKTQKVILLR